MKIKLAAKRAIFTILTVAFLSSPLSCARGMSSSADFLSRFRPASTGAVGGGGAEDPFIPPAETAAGSTVVPTFAPTPEFTPTPLESSTPEPPVMYYTQAGDTLAALALRFSVKPEEIKAPTTTGALPQQSLLNPGQLLLIPKNYAQVSSSKQLMPDSETVFSPSGLDFDAAKFVQEAGGYLSTYREYRATGWLNGPQVIMSVATENSINPRLLLAILEYQSHWVYGQPQNLAQTDYPLGNIDPQRQGLYFQLSWAVGKLNIGYYGWREGRLTEIAFKDNSKVRLAPDLNAGTVAVQNLFASLYDQPQWAGALYGDGNLVSIYEKMFGSPWVRAQTVEPLFPATITQPPLELPFLPGRRWSLTGGPHAAWGNDGARAALDFAPGTTVHGCYQSDEWVTASASGMVVRIEPGMVVLDLDGDGYEQTGWNILYLHISTTEKVALNTWVNKDDRIGHPSCEGGNATGTHVHMARKYNGEWILADGPMPFDLSGWVAHAGDQAYYGWLTRGNERVDSSLVGSYESRIVR